MEGEQGADSLGELRSLVLAAFEQARVSAKPEWHVMTTGVLKNRMLQLTSRKFDEEQFGARTFAELMLMIPDVVELDAAHKPPLVSLKIEGGAPTATETDVETGRVRPDLWYSILDYSSEDVYIWDGTHAVRVSEPEADALVMPTISESEMSLWRREFADESGEHLDEWVERGLGTFALPPHLRRTWSTTVKQKVIRILAAWFQEHDIPAPVDLLTQSSTPLSSKAVNEGEELRRFVQRCIALMTLGELRSLPIPAAVALRARS